MGIGALGLVNRGFDTVVKPTLEKPLAESGCVSCGQCVSVCPTGALQERLSLSKPVPLDTVSTDTTCPYCSIGCSISLESYGNLLVKSVPNKEGAVNKGLLCGRGKFGFDCSELEGKITEPMLRSASGDEFEPSDYYDAFVTTAKKAQSVAAKYGRDAVAVAISDRYTNEEIYAIKSLADEIGASSFSFNNRVNGLADVIGVDASPNTIDELLSTEVILAIGFDLAEHPVAFLKLKQAAEAGAKVILINPKDLKQNHFAFAEECVYTANNMKFLKEIAKGVVESGAAKELAGFEEFADSLDDVKVSAKASDIVSAYVGAKKAMIIYQQNTITTDAAALIGDIAVLSGHIGSPRDGILMLRPKNNSQGLVDQGIIATACDVEGVKALLIFGEDPIGAAARGGVSPESKAALKLMKDAEVVMVCDTHMTDTAKAADAIIPGTGFSSIDGTYTNTERRLQIVQEAVLEDVMFSNWEVAKEIAHVCETEFPWEDTNDISAEMEDALPIYRCTAVDEAFGGALKPSDVNLVTVGNGKFADKLASSDNLMNMIEDRIPDVKPLPADM
jgi:formate dehydrogenase major subunit